MITILLLLMVFVIAFVTFGSSKFKGQTTIVYQDEGKRSKVFINKKFGVAAKPDIILNTIDGYICTEYKGRKKGIYESDIIEAKAAALAVRSKYPIVAIQIKNQTESRVYPLPKSDKELYEHIRQYKEMADVAHSQLLPAKPNRPKCHTCPVKSSCNESVG